MKPVDTQPSLWVPLSLRSPHPHPLRCIWELHLALVPFLIVMTVKPSGQLTWEPLATFSHLPSVGGGALQASFWALLGGDNGGPILLQNLLD